MTKVFVIGNRIEHVGHWDFQRDDVEVSNNPWVGEGAAPEDWDYEYRTETVIGNPIPADAQEIDAEIEETAKGRLVLATDWHSLREDAYPPLKDQLDAMWKGGEASQEMAALVQSIKDRYPKTEAS
jgi:hypothetical protein